MARKILVVDDEDNMRHMLEVLLQEEGYEVWSAKDGEKALQELEEDTFDFVVCDVRMPKVDGPALLDKMKKRGLSSTVIMMSAYGNIDTAIETMKKGAYDYIPKPFRTDEIILTLRKAEEREKLQRENVILRRAVATEYSLENIITRNPKMIEILDTIKKVGPYKSTILVTGESGTGKELIAKAIHYSSNRQEGPFIPINCGAIPEQLLESELFGHVKGAFTDAVSTKRGLFEEATDGTIYLDEIGEIPLSLQVKLLRVLEEEQIRRVGDTQQIPVNVRIVASTLRDLNEDVKQGRFRADLFYRLNVMNIHIPPLRERAEDIPLLVDRFIKANNESMGKQIQGVTSDVMEVLLAYPWDGNVRELENAMERAMTLAEGSHITRKDLPPYLVQQESEGTLTIPDNELSIKKVSRQVEEALIRRALTKTGGNRTKAAKILEISHRALLYKIKDYGIES
ncbi:MAG: sigma-54 dependent transcriptional regulator [bacterium]